MLRASRRAGRVLDLDQVMAMQVNTFVESWGTTELKRAH